MKNTNENTVSVKSLGSFCSDEFNVSLSDYNFGLYQSWHTHEEFILTMILKGYVREQVKRRDVVINPLSVGIKAPEISHTDHFGESGVRVVRISISPSFFCELKEKSLIKEDWNWVADSEAISPFLRIADNLLNDRSNIIETSDEIYEILAALLPMKSAKLIKDVPMWLRRSMENLRELFAEGIRLTELAQYANVHPVYFARQFRSFFGCSVGEYIRQLQFQKAYSLLLTGKYNLAQIAYQVGFSDQSHLTRTFVNRFGITPANIRKLLK